VYSESPSAVVQTCIEATVRYAAELGYEVTVVKDATADYSRDDACCLDINIPNYVSAIVTTSQISAFIRPGVGRA